MIKASYAPEVISAFRIYHNAFQRCLLMKNLDDQDIIFPNAAFVSCFSFSNLDIDDPIASPGSHFDALAITRMTGGANYCYWYPARMIDRDNDDVLLFQYCNQPFGFTLPKGPTGITVSLSPGITIVGDGAFKGTKIGPGIVN